MIIFVQAANTLVMPASRSNADTVGDHPARFPKGVSYALVYT